MNTPNRSPDPQPTDLVAHMQPGDEIQVVITGTGVQISLIRLGDDRWRVCALDCYGRPVDTSVTYTDQLEARAHARNIVEQRRSVNCRTLPLSVTVRRGEFAWALPLQQ